MKLVLTDFMEMVSLKDPKNAKRFLVFSNEAGQELQVPVGRETIAVIATFALTGAKPVRPVPQEDLEEEVSYDAEPEDKLPVDLDAQVDEDATHFGGDVEEGNPSENEDPMEAFELPSAPEPEVPESEEGIPSL